MLHCCAVLCTMYSTYVLIHGCAACSTIRRGARTSRAPLSGRPGAADTAPDVTPPATRFKRSVFGKNRLCFSSRDEPTNVIGMLLSFLLVLVCATSDDDIVAAAAAALRSRWKRDTKKKSPGIAEIGRDRTTAAAAADTAVCTSVQAIVLHARRLYECMCRTYVHRSSGFVEPCNLAIL